MKFKISHWTTVIRGLNVSRAASSCCADSLQLRRNELSHRWESILHRTASQQSKRYSTVRREEARRRSESTAGSTSQVFSQSFSRGVSWCQRVASFCQRKGKNQHSLLHLQSAITVERRQPDSDSDNFIFHRDGAPAHTSAVTQDWLAHNPLDFIGKDQWPPNSPDLNPLNYHVWRAMLHIYHMYSLKSKNKEKLRVVFQTIWDALPQSPIDRAILTFRRRLRTCITAEGKHFEHAL